MRIGIACAAAMWVAIGGSGVSVWHGFVLLSLALIGGLAISEKLDAIVRACDRD